MSYNFQVTIKENFYERKKMIYYLLIFSAFIVPVSNYIVNISVPIFLTESLNATRFEIGVAGFVGNFGYTIMTLFLSHLFKNKKLSILVYPPILIGISYLILPHLPICLFFSLMFFIGLFYARFWPLLQTCFRNAPVRFIGNLNLAWAFGVIIGSFISGYLYSKGKFLPFLISGILCILAGVLIIYKKRNIDSLNIDNKKKIEKNRKKFKIKEIRYLNFMNFFTVGVMLFIFPRYALELKCPPSSISQMISVILITRFTGFLILKKKSFINSKYILPVSSFCHFLVYFLLGMFKTPSYFILSFIILGGLSALLYHNSLIAHLEGGYRTEIHEGIVGAGFLTGSLIAGFLSQILNFKVTFLLLGTAFLLIGIFYVLKKKYFTANS